MFSGYIFGGPIWNYFEILFCEAYDRLQKETLLAKINLDQQASILKCGVGQSITKEIGFGSYWGEGTEGYFVVFGLLS